MLTSISPVGEHGRGQRWAVTVIAYVIGSVAGGALLGALLGTVGALLLGWLTAPMTAAALAAVAAAGLAADAGWRGWRLPTRHRQVDENWLTRYRGWVYGLAFGFQLGLGVVTLVASSVLYVVLTAALLTRSTTAGLLVGATFGLARGLPLVGMARVRSTDRLARVHRRLDGLASPADRLTRVLQAATAAVLVAAVLAWGVLP